MAKNMGEFEERPEVKEATPIPFKRRRPIGWMVATAVFAVISVGAVSFAIIGAMTKNNADTECAVAEESKKSEEAATPEEEVKTKTIADTGKGYVYSSMYHGVFYVTNTGDVYYVPSERFTSGNENIEFKVKYSDDLGEKGKFTLEYDDFDDWGPWADNQGAATFTVNGYKLDLQNIVSVTEGQYGQQKINASTIFIDQEGNLSTLTSTSLYEKTVSYTLRKNVEKDVRSVSNGIGTNYVTTVIHYMDGHSRTANNKKLFGAEM